MAYDNGMMPGPDMSDKPWGNSNSLVPEIAGRGVNGKPLPPCPMYKAPKITQSTMNRNNSFEDLNQTGKS